MLDAVPRVVSLSRLEAVPFPTEHAARQLPPEDFESFRRGHPEGFPTGVDVIYGIRKSGTAEIQSVRLSADYFTPAQAIKWLEDHNFKSALEEAKADSGGSVRFDDADGAGPVLSESVRRWDFAELASPKKTDEGFMRAQGYITRAGVFPYLLANGRQVLEFRPPEEVFAPEAIESFSLVPLTLDHPPDNLTPEMVREYQVGTVGQPQQVADHLKSDVLITDPRAIAAVEGGKQQLSCGYTCQVADRPGVWIDRAGIEHRFDSIQSKIRGNHVAIVDMARAGPTVSIRKDSKDGVGEFRAEDKGDAGDRRIDKEWDATYINDLPDAAFALIQPGGEKDGEGKTVPRTLRALPHHNASVKSGAENETVDLPHLRNALARLEQTDLTPDQKNKARAHLEAHAKALLETAQKKDDDVKIKIADKEFEVPQNVADALADQTKRADASDGALAALKAEHEKLQGKIASLESQTEKQRKQDSDTSAMTERLTLLAQAASVLEKPVKDLVRMDAGALMRAVVAKESPEISLEGKSDDFVRGIFEHVTTKRVDTAEALNILAGKAKDSRADSAEDEATKAYQRMIDNYQNAWKPKDQKSA